MEESSDVSGMEDNDYHHDYEGEAADDIGSNPDQWKDLCEYLQSSPSRQSSLRIPEPARVED